MPVGLLCVFPMRFDRVLRSRGDATFGTPPRTDLCYHNAHHRVGRLLYPSASDVQRNVVGARRCSDTSFVDP